MTYRSHADLGGTRVDAPVVPEPESGHFHADWERRVLAITVAMGATRSWNIDTSRSARETLPDYPSLTYYQIWFEGLVRLLEQRDLVQADEVAQGHALHATRPVAKVLAPDELAATLARGSPTERPAATSPRFALGDAVLTRATAVDHHTRLPAYARGRRGRIERVHGVHVFADAHATGDESPQWLYTVAFDGRELWPDAVDDTLRVSIDAWESYLSPAP